MQTQATDLQNMDQTPPVRSTSKRPCTILSPLNEDTIYMKLQNLINSADEGLLIGQGFDSDPN